MEQRATGWSKQGEQGLAQQGEWSKWWPGHSLSGEQTLKCAAWASLPGRPSLSYQVSGKLPSEGARGQQKRKQQDRAEGAF